MVLKSGYVYKKGGEVIRTVRFMDDDEQDAECLEMIGLIENGEDLLFDPVEVSTQHSKAFEEIRRAIDPLRSGWHNFTITKDAWGKL